MAKWNSCRLEGNIGKDPERRDRMTTFSLAVWQGKDRPTLWLHCKAFDLAIPFARGNKVRVDGRLFFETYQGKDGLQKTVWGVIVEECVAVEREEPVTAARPEYKPMEMDEDVPF